MGFNSFVLLFGIIFCSVIQASVINVNVFEEGKPVKSSHILSDCNVVSCDQLCRRLGFPGGGCTSNQCNCNTGHFLHDGLEDNIDEYPAIEKNLNEMNEVFNDEETSEVKDCALNACEQFCRRLGYPGGACVNGKCDCDRFKGGKYCTSAWKQDNQFVERYLCRTHDEPIISFQSAIFIAGNSKKLTSKIQPLGCNILQCNLACMSRGFRVGVCIKGACICIR